MIQYKSGDVYLNDETDIIFNPVGVRDDNKGFLKKVKLLYPCVYEKYHEEVWMYNEKELMGEIQVVKIADKRVVFNGFCKDRNGNIDKIAFVKNLVELYNLAHEYHLSIGIEYALGVMVPAERKCMSTIIKEVFSDMDDEKVIIYDRSRM